MRLNTNDQPWRFWLISLVIIGVYVLAPATAWSRNSTLGITMDIFGRRLDLPAMSIPDFNSTYARFPQDQVTIIILTNRELWAGVVGDEIMKVMFDLP